MPVLMHADAIIEVYTTSVSGSEGSFLTDAICAQVVQPLDLNDITGLIDVTFELISNSAGEYSYSIINQFHVAIYSYIMTPINV